MKVKDLNEQYYAKRDAFPEPFRLRVHRALSWLERADVLCADGEQELSSALKLNVPNAKVRLSEQGWQALDKAAADWDLAFVSLWIAFNAVYARDLDLKESQDKVHLRDFLGLICKLDNDQLIYDLVWQRFSSDIRILLNNRYVFQPFWDFHNGLIVQAAFEEQFQKMRARANEALAGQDTVALLILVFNCLYTLRNQIVHGGSTWNSSANREQVKSACGLLGKMLPVFLWIMMHHPHDDAWGKPFYPFVKE